MTRDEHLWIRAMEECAELAQRISKGLVFGLGEVQPGQTLTNHERILGEFTDLIAVLEMVGVKAHHIRVSDIAEKQRKVRKYLAYSEECGTLDALRQPADVMEPMQGEGAPSFEATRREMEQRTEAPNLRDRI